MLSLASSSPFAEYYLEKINSFLHVYFYDDFCTHRDLQKEKGSQDLDLEEELYPFFGGFHLLREDPQKCLQVTEDLCCWSDDYFVHHLDNLHNFALYNFLHYVASMADDEPFQSIYFDDPEEKRTVKTMWKNLDTETFDGKISLREFTAYLHDMYTLIDTVFEDIDFITFPQLICEAVTHDEDMPAALVEDYREILPKDILKHYQEIHNEDNFRSKLFEDLAETWARLAHDLKYTQTYKLLWKGEVPADENSAHNYLQTVLSEHFANQNVALDHEVNYGTGRADFRVVREGWDKVLLEVKLGSNNNLSSGLTKQLVHYMDAERCEQAFYLIFCHTEEELAHAQKFAKTFSPLPRKTIEVVVFDATKKVAASRL